MCVKEESDTDTASEEEENAEFPPVPYRLARVKGKGTYNADDILQDAKASKQQIINLSNATKDQPNSAMWNAHRRGRVTASNSHKILHSQNPITALRRVMQYDLVNISGIPAVKWGIDNEPVTKEQYCKYMQDMHSNFCFEETVSAA